MNVSRALRLHLRRRCAWITCATFLLALVAGIALSEVAAEPLRVVVVAPNRAPGDGLDVLQAEIRQTFGFTLQAVTSGNGSRGRPSLSALRTADAAIVHRGPGELSSSDAALLREYLNSGLALVLIAATPDQWPSEPQFAADVLGATPGTVFAGGASMAVINLFPHPIFSGVSRFEADQPVLLYTRLADDAQMIMEGTVGEATAPLAWVRRRAAGRMAHFVFSTPEILADPAYQRMLGQAVLWAARRAIPGAQAAVQRTFMPDAYPGAFAITLPNGPGVCLDPVRGGINYIWAGDFVDLRPRWLTKVGEPARIFGPIFYRETAWQPLRAGSPTAEPDYQFHGYTLRNGVPEFHYQVGGRDVYETLGSQGGAHTLQRRFRVGPGNSPLWITLEPQAGAEVTVRGLERDGNLATFAPTAGGEFTIDIRPRSLIAP